MRPNDTRILVAGEVHGPGIELVAGKRIVILGFKHPERATATSGGLRATRKAAGLSCTSTDRRFDEVFRSEQAPRRRVNASQGTKTCDRRVCLLHLPADHSSSGVASVVCLDGSRASSPAIAGWWYNRDKFTLRSPPTAPQSDDALAPLRALQGCRVSGEPPAAPPLSKPLEPLVVTRIEGQEIPLE